MTIASMEALEALPEGAQVSVRSGSRGTLVWTRVENGFSDGLAVMGTHLFSGYITEGRVRRYDNTPAGPGDWFTARRYSYHVIRTNEDGSLTAIRYNSTGDRVNEAAYPPRQINPEAMERLSGPPDSVLRNLTTVRDLLDRYWQMLAESQRELALAREELARKPEKKEPATEEFTMTITVDGRVVGITTPGGAFIADASDDDKLPE